MGTHTGTKPLGERRKHSSNSFSPFGEKVRMRGSIGATLTLTLSLKGEGILVGDVGESISLEE